MTPDTVSDVIHDAAERLRGRRRSGIADSQPNAKSFLLRVISALLLLAILLAARPAPAADHLADGISQNLVLAADKQNPRNSDGDFINLKDGRILFVYSHFIDGNRNDSAADLVSRASADNGKTWSGQDEPVTDAKSNGVKTVMSASLLRLGDGRIALFYLAKKSATDLQVLLRTSGDEAKTWSAATVCSEGPGYAVASNGRALQLKSGRIVLPVGWHEMPIPPDGFDRGMAVCLYSDDSGVTWHRSKAGAQAPPNSHSGMQYPAVVELKDGRLMMLMSMHLRPLQRSYSSDAGETWSPPESTDLATPIAPAALRRIPSTGDLLLVWNDQSHADAALKNKRTPFTVAISSDEGKTWIHRRNLYADPDGTYTAAAIGFQGDRVLIGHSASTGKRDPSAGVITSFDLKWVYGSP